MILKVIFLFVLFYLLNTFSSKKYLSSPRLVETDEDESTIEYTFKMNGKNVHLNLAKSKSITNYEPTYAVNGKAYHLNFNINNCLYEGFIVGKNKSCAYINICRGFNGVIDDSKQKFFLASKTENLADNIIEYSKTNAGLNREEIKHECGYESIKTDTEEISNNSFDDGASIELGKQSIEDDMIKNNSRILKYSIVVDQSTFYQPDCCNGSITDTIIYFTSLVHSLKFYFNPMNFTAIIMHLDIQTKINPECPIYSNATTDDVNACLKKYRTDLTKINKQYDITLFYKDTSIYHNKMVVSGFAHGGLCKFPSALYSATYPLNSALLILAHETGHVFGLPHVQQRKEKCVFTTQFPIMNNAYSFGDSARYGYTDCDIRDILKKFDDPNTCLKFPIERDAIGGFCGNGIVEEGEECDCGPPKNCYISGKHSCCNPYTCQYLPKEPCNNSPCCFNCDIKSNESVCYSSDGCKIGNCDGEKYKCNIKNPIPEGTLCNVKGTCSDGLCLIKEEQCKFLFGHMSNLAPESYVKEFNSKGTIDGNCGIDPNNKTNYLKCMPSNMLCGNLICTFHSFFNKNVVGVSFTLSPDRKCVSAVVFNNTRQYNRFSSNFLQCGNSLENYCYNHECKKADIYTDPSKKPISCSNNSIINDNKECQCIENFILSKGICVADTNNLKHMLTVLLPSLFGTIIVLSGIIVGGIFMLRKYKSTYIVRGSILIQKNSISIKK